MMFKAPAVPKSALLSRPGDFGANDILAGSHGGPAHDTSQKPWAAGFYTSTSFDI